MGGRRERVCGVRGGGSGAQMSASAAIQTELGELLRSSRPRMFSSNFLGPENHESLVKNIEVPVPPRRVYFSISNVGSLPKILPFKKDPS